MKRIALGILSDSFVCTQEFKPYKLKNLPTMTFKNLSNLLILTLHLLLNVMEVCLILCLTTIKKWR